MREENPVSRFEALGIIRALINPESHTKVNQALMMAYNSLRKEEVLCSLDSGIVSESSSLPRSSTIPSDVVITLLSTAQPVSPTQTTGGVEYEDSTAEAGVSEDQDEEKTKE